MSAERPIFEDIDPAAEEAAIERAMEDYRAGRVIANDKVVAWLKTWGTPDFKPLPREWLE